MGTASLLAGAGAEEAANVTLAGTEPVSGWSLVSSHAHGALKRRRSSWREACTRFRLTFITTM